MRQHNGRRARRLAVMAPGKRVDAAFGVRHFAGLQILSAQSGIGASPLGRELVTRVARDEVESR